MYRKYLKNLIHLRFSFALHAPFLDCKTQYRWKTYRQFNLKCNPNNRKNIFINLFELNAKLAKIFNKILGKINVESATSTFFNWYLLLHILKIVFFKFFFCYCCCYTISLEDLHRIICVLKRKNQSKKRQQTLFRNTKKIYKTKKLNYRISRKTTRKREWNTPN